MKNQCLEYKDGQEAFAIVGLAFEFPGGATSEHTFWQMLHDGRCASTDFPRSRLNIDAFYHPDQSRPSSISLRGGHFCEEDLGAFDAPFFSITPGEAACMDPQHRHMLETCFHALEDAGIPIAKCSGSDTSVYTGCFTNDYLSILNEDYEAEQRHAVMGVASSMLANRVSWFFNLKGASMNLDSACSSSLVALHLACQDLRAGTTSMALVGGVNLVYHPHMMKFMTDFNFLSRDSRCWSFDQRANGYARGEGVAMVVVKRLQDALRDGDTIRAVIRNTGINQDGKTPGITQPSGEAQVNLIRQTFQQAGNLDMGPTRFFEAHGTGTPVGDPVEANAIGTAFHRYRSSDDPLYVGAVKGNIGHLEGCSGLAGLIKTILVLENGVIPPIAGFRSLNTRVNSRELHLKFPTTTAPWPTCLIRRACVNSFGFGGTNAVVILDDARSYLQVRGLQGHHRTQDNTMRDSTSANAGLWSRNMILNGSTSPRKPKLLVWSTHDEAGVRRLSESYCCYLSHGRTDIKDLAYQLAVRKSGFDWKAFAVVDTETNSTMRNVSVVGPIRATGDVQIAFAFTGQGAQYLGMGSQLLAYPVFRQSLETSSSFLKRLGCQWSVFEFIESREQDQGQDRDFEVNMPAYAQPLTTCLQIALVDLLSSFAISPSVVLGHSSGEIAAAYAAGALSQAAAIKVAYHRGVLSSKLASKASGLTMMAVGLSKQKAIPYLNRLEKTGSTVDVSIGCINSPKSITLTGDAVQLATVEQWLHDDAVFARKLRIPVAYHSRFMESIADEYAHSVGVLERGSETISVPMISSVTGDIVTADRLVTSRYWTQNLTSPVDFEGAMARLLSQTGKAPRRKLGKAVSLGLKVTHLLEIGPHSALQGPIRESLQTPTSLQKPTYIASLRRGLDGAGSLLHAVGSLYCAGYAADLVMANCLGDSTQRRAPPNMPRYPFNHSQSYWRESRLSQNFRFRETARHDLLGTRSLDWNPQIAQWRNVMRLAEVPWIEDHRIGDDIVFPAAGMVVMAVEGLRELITTSASAAAPLRGFQLHNVSFSHPISFARGTDLVETQLTVSVPSRLPIEAAWCQYRLFVLENDSYIECSSGSIRAVTKDPRGQASEPLRLDHWIDQISTACQSSEPQNPYTMVVGTGSGLRYGPTFQNIEQMRVSNGGEATAQINTESWRPNSPDSSTLSPSYIIHPTTLDGLAQLMLPALAKINTSMPPMVPVHAASIWIDCVDNSVRQGTMSVAARCRVRGQRGASADIAAMANGSATPLIYVDGLKTSFIGEAGALNSRALNHRTLCTRLLWKLDVDMLDNEQLRLHCLRNRPKQPSDALQTYHTLIAVIMSFIDQALGSLVHFKVSTLPKHLQAYVYWMEYQRRRLYDGDAPVLQEYVQSVLRDSSLRIQLINQLDASAEGHFFMEVCRNLAGILCGDVDPLQLMFSNNLSERYYSAVLANDSHSHPVIEFAEILSFKNPSMRIMEVGAGTGGQTLRLLEALNKDGIKKWERYDYTDISPEFFDQAREKFHSYLGQMQFRVCDISKDPVLQAFEAESYDLVIASHVLHATNDLGESLRNIRKLLKADGKLLLLETTEPDAIHIGFAFGLLKSWWSPLDHDKSRSAHSPCITVEQWHQRLLSAGFSGVDVEFPGQEALQCQYTSIIVSSAVAQGNGTVPRALGLQLPKIIVVVDEAVGAQLRTANILQKQFHTDSFICNTHTLAEISQLSRPEESGPISTLTIFLLELGAVFLNGITEKDYNKLHSVLMQSPTTLWVTRGKPQDPRLSLVEGMGRVLMSEDSSRKFVTLRLDKEDKDEDQEKGLIEDKEDSCTTPHLISKLGQRFIDSPVEELETSYAVKQGRLLIMRVSENSALDKAIASAILPYQTKESRLVDNTQLSLQQDLLGSSVSTECQWAETGFATNDHPLDDDEILVQVRAIGLTMRDGLIASGQLDQTGLGTECAGVVRSAGEASGARQGDRVCLIACPTTQSIIRIRKGGFSMIPSHMSFAEAASMPTASWLAYHALVNVARLQKGETILIHKGASCVGQMAIQLARTLGARVLVTASSAEKRAFLLDRVGMLQSAILDPNDGHGSLMDTLHRETRGSGIDVVIGPLTDADHDSDDFLPSLAPFGRLVDISLESSDSQFRTGARLQPVNVPANVSRISINMVDLLCAKPSTVYKTFQEAMKMAFVESFLPPQPLRSFSADKASVALRDLLDRDMVGKRVLELDPDLPITARIKTRPSYNFTADATYVIAGGLGGLGRSIARWMVSRGARHLILLSRSGAQTPTAKSLVDQLENQGVSVATPSTDIADSNSVGCVLDSLGRSMPPIKGCIQATMVLKDTMFQNMSYADWIISTRPKVAGSWNLHELLPSNLDFFVMLSSINGIFGGRAQANYAAGNTYQDALARYRRACGQKATSIDLGMMVSEGVVAENKDLLASLRRIGHLMDIKQEELFALLDHYCDPDLPLVDVNDGDEYSSAQVLVGIEMPSAILAKGIDLHHSIHRPLFRHLFRMGIQEGQGGITSHEKAAVDKGALMRTAETEEEAVQLVTGWFLTKVANVLGLPETEIDIGKPAHAYGMDSLVAIDLKNWFAKEIGADISVFMLMGNTPLDHLSAAAAVKSRHRQETPLLT